MKRKLTYNELLVERDQLKSELEKALSTIKYLVEQKKAMTRKYSDLT
jgi:hypothetical protein